MIKLNFKTYSDLAKDIRISISKIPEDVCLIVGNPRSGMIPAYMIGAFLNKPVSTLDEYLNGIIPSFGERKIKGGANKNKVLIVDDSINTGRALDIIKRKLQNKKSGAEYIFFAVYATNKSKELIDIYAKICEQPRIFQWNYLYHNILANSCFDIDGVLCVDPTVEQNDDGEKYVEFILNAKPLYIPNYKIKALVTSRLEKYRNQTEKWLRRNNVLYEELYMLNLPTKEDRIKSAAHGKFKAEIYGKLSECILFVESNRDQAIEIANATKKPVISLETDEIFEDFHLDLGKEDIFTKLNDEIISLKKSKSFLLESLILGLIKSPKKWITSPFDLIFILIREDNLKKIKEKLKFVIFTPNKFFAKYFKFLFPYKKQKLIMTILARDEEDIIRNNIEYHLSHGVDFIIATDNASIDGTRKIFKDYEAQGKLFLIDEPGRDKSQAAWNNRMTKIAIEKYGADAVFHCDADEFWHSESGNLKNEIFKHNENVLVVDVFNVLLKYRNGKESFPEDTRYLVQKTIDLLTEDYELKNKNMYLFKYPPKVVLKTKEGVIEVTQGNHGVVDSGKDIKVKNLSDIKIYHFPLRGRDRFFNKVIETGKAVEKNSLLTKDMSFHIRKWYDAYKNKSLENEYKNLTVVSEEINDLKKEGIISDFDFNEFIKK